MQDTATISQQRFSSCLKLRAEMVKLHKQDDQTDGAPELQERVDQWDVLAGLRNYAAEHVMLVGKPGSGKSISLERLLWEEAEKALQDPNARIPVLVKLRRCTGTVEGLIQNFLVAHQVDLKIVQIEELLRQGRFFLLLDGLNELPKAFETEVANFRDRYRRTTPMVISTRDLGRSSILGIEKTLKMLPLTEPQMREFVRGYLGEKGDCLFQQLQNNRLRKFAETPLLLWMLCRVFAYNDKVPDNLGFAFREFAQLYDQRFQADAPADSKDQWHKLLRHLAFVMMQGKSSLDPQLSIPREEAEDCLTDYLQQVGWSNPRECAERWLSDLLKYHLIQPVIQPNLEEHIEFRHQLIQEYYAAEYLLRLLQLPDRERRLTDDQLKRDYLNYLKWTEPLALLLALTPDESLAMRVVEQALAVDLMLGARLAGEVKSEFQEQTVELLNQLTEQKNLPEWLRVELWRKTRSDVVLPKMFQALNNQNIEIARTAAAAIGYTTNQTAIDLLTSRLEEIDSKFFAQASFGGADRTGDIWIIHIEALSYIAPQQAIQFLRKNFDPINGRDHIILIMVTGASELLMKLDGEALLPDLIEQLRNTKYEHCKNRILNIISSANKDIKKLFIPQLIQALEEEEIQSIQIRLIKLIGDVSSQSATQVLVRFLAQPKPELRKEVIKQLIKRDIQDFTQLEELLAHENLYVAYSAAAILGHFGKTSALRILSGATRCHVNSTLSISDIDEYEPTEEALKIATKEQLRDASDRFKQIETRLIATKALGKIDHEESVSCLFNVLHTDESEYVRREAAFSLSNLGKREVVPELLSALDNTGLDGRINSIKGLIKLGEEEPLWNILQAKSVGWQTAAVELGKLGKTEVLSDLCEALADPGSESSNEVIRLLAELADSNTCNWLVNALDNPEPYQSDQYFCNRIAFVLVECRSEVVRSCLPALEEIIARSYVRQIFWLIPAIQANCKFYKYDLYQAHLS